MNPKELLPVLEKLRISLEKLLENAKFKQTALVKMNDEQLIQAISDEEKYIKLVKENEKERLNKTIEIYKQNGKKFNDYKLTVFVKEFKDSLDDKSLKYFLGYEKLLKKLTTDVMNVNRQNLFLIEHSRQFITSLMNIIYQDKTRSLVDRKV